jgi:hypothetical protein
MSEVIPDFAKVSWMFLGAAFAATALWLGVRFVNRRERWTKQAAIGLAATLALYIMSSGPMKFLAFRTQIVHVSTILPNGTPAIQATSNTNLGTWFPIAYAPMLWASEQSWGEFVFWYWELFPNRRTDDET